MVEEIESLGATSAVSVAALASSAEVVVVCVFTDDQVREVCLGNDGLIAAMPAGSTLVVHSTCRPDTAPTLAEHGRVSDVGVVDAPFSGGPADAARGALTLLVGGDEAVLEAVRAVLATYADPIIHVGALGDGQRVKLVNNALFGANVRLVVEAERLAGDLGLDAAKAIEAISYCSANSYALTLAKQTGSAATAPCRYSWASHNP